MIKRLLLVLTSLFTFSALADWQLVPESSGLHFLTTKNAQVTETHSFESISGTLDKRGNLIVSVDLASVNTHIPIRDTRMKEKLFSVANFPKAKFTATIASDLIALPVGNQTRQKIAGTVDLHGVEAPVEFDVIVARSTKSQFVVSTVAPTVLNATTFNLQSGVNTLQEIAGLKSITLAVPVTFSVTFAK